MRTAAIAGWDGSIVMDMEDSLLRIDQGYVLIAGFISVNTVRYLKDYVSAMLAMCLRASIQRTYGLAQIRKIREIATRKADRLLAKRSGNHDGQFVGNA